MRKIRAFNIKRQGKVVASIVEVGIGHGHRYQAIQSFQRTKQRYRQHHNEG